MTGSWIMIEEIVKMQAYDFVESLAMLYCPGEVVEAIRKE